MALPTSGNGELNWPAIIAALRGIGYDGTISIKRKAVSIRVTTRWRARLAICMR